MSGPVQFTQANLLAGLIGGGIQDSEDEPAHLLARKAVKAKPLAPKNVVQLAKARLREVQLELRRMKALEKERDELQRLVSAAENKPRLVALKRSAG